MENVSWDDLRVLLAVHRAGSLLGAGRLLGLSTSTTGRRLDALEGAVGAKLVHRDQKGAELAPAAVRLVQLAEGFEHGLHAQKRDKQFLAGTIKVSVPDGLAAPIAQALMTFHREHPSIDIELVGENRMADVAKREADIALRLVRSTSNLLVQKQVATLRFSLFASADYARRRLPDRRLRKQDASAHNFIGLDTRWKGLPQEKLDGAAGSHTLRPTVEFNGRSEGGRSPRHRLGCFGGAGRSTCRSGPPHHRERRADPAPLSCLPPRPAQCTAPSRGGEIH